MHHENPGSCPVSHTWMAKEERAGACHPLAWCLPIAIPLPETSRDVDPCTWTVLPCPVRPPWSNTLPGFTEISGLPSAKHQSPAHKTCQKSTKLREILGWSIIPGTGTAGRVEHHKIYQVSPDRWSLRSPESQGISVHPTRTLQLLNRQVTKSAGHPTWASGQRFLCTFHHGRKAP